MIKIENYCKPDVINLLGVKGAFDDEIDGELKPCPLCGRIPKPMVRTDSLDGYFSAVSCFGGTLFSHAYVSARGHGNYTEVMNKAINEWNNGIIMINDKENAQKRHLYSMKDNALIEDRCGTCIYCSYHKASKRIPHFEKYICQKKGIAILNTKIQNCDDMYMPKIPKV